MRYSLVILTKSGDIKFELKTMSMYEWDMLLGFDNTLDTLRDMNKFELVLNHMICSFQHDLYDSFFKYLYGEILDKDRKFAEIYKTDLFLLIYKLHYDIFENSQTERLPKLVYIEGFFDSKLNLNKYDYINEDWNYSYVANLMNMNTLGNLNEQSK
ncbi:hypothetical protein DB313_05770 (plasmid) [Borrelia turcica IST7]|uniref:Uncharacterized protein n=1 Tax=Borrelia turcica IST7 TaxID=1104446 RepID=A0A386PQU4_9SPIR|nr:DUF1473 family protein [Borrelia turcica]AYE37007.1 hypothetical protein DB313_05770 [Borrelia turcica IST7]